MPQLLFLAWGKHRAKSVTHRKRLPVVQFLCSGLRNHVAPGTLYLEKDGSKPARIPPHTPRGPSRGTEGDSGGHWRGSSRSAAGRDHAQRPLAAKAPSWNRRFPPPRRLPETRKSCALQFRDGKASDVPKTCPALFDLKHELCSHSEMPLKTVTESNPSVSSGLSCAAKLRRMVFLLITWCLCFWIRSLCLNRNRVFKYHEMLRGHNERNQGMGRGDCDVERGKWKEAVKS